MFTGADCLAWLHASPDASGHRACKALAQELVDHALICRVSKHHHRMHVGLGVHGSEHHRAREFKPTDHTFYTFQVGFL